MLRSSGALGPFPWRALSIRRRPATLLAHARYVTARLVLELKGGDGSHRARLLPHTATQW